MEDEQYVLSEDESDELLVTEVDTEPKRCD